MGGRIAHSFCYEVVHDGVVKDDEDEGEVVADDAESLLILFYPAPEASVAICATSENDDGDGERDTPCDSVIHTFVGFYAAPLFAHKNLKNVVRDNRGPKKRTHVEKLGHPRRQRASKPITRFAWLEHAIISFRSKADEVRKRREYIRDGQKYDNLVRDVLSCGKYQYENAMNVLPKIDRIAPIPTTVRSVVV